MKLDALAAFVAVADLRSLSRAAVASDLAPSMLSRQVAALEREWGARLFDRTGRGMALSDFGRRMLPEARRVLEQLRHLDVAAGEAAGVLTGTVHVGVLPSLAPRLVPMLFADLRERAPTLRLHATEGFSGSLDEQLASGRLDMIVVNRYGSAALRGEDALGRLDTFLVGDPASAILHGTSRCFRDLGGVPLVLPAAPNGLRSTLQVLARRHGIALDVALEVETSTAMKDVALAGHAFTLLPITAVRDEVADGRLAAIRVVRPGIPRTVALSLTRRRPLSAGGRVVAARVRQLVPRLLRG